MLGLWRAPATAAPAPVKVPDAFKDEQGLVTRADLGEEWPLTVGYGVVTCEIKTQAARHLDCYVRWTRRHGVRA